MVTWLFAFATTFAAFRSAWYWYRSSQIYAVPDWVEVGRAEPTDPLQVQLGWMNALMKASGETNSRSQQVGCHLDCCDCYFGRCHDGSERLVGSIRTLPTESTCRRRL